MAFYTNALNAPIHRSIMQSTGAFFAKLADTQDRTAQLRELANLDDAGLAKLGLRRNQIVQHVYNDIYNR